jgi:hypothetical protein
MPEREPRAFSSELEPRPLNELPTEASLVHTYTVEAGNSKVELPLYEVPVRAQDKNMSYVSYMQGWPKHVLNGPLKQIVETSLFWGVQASYEDQENYYYSLNCTRQPDGALPKDEVNKKVEWRWKMAQRAFKTVSKMGA